jgi:hypothetical protein
MTKDAREERGDRKREEGTVWFRNKAKKKNGYPGKRGGLKL